MFIEYQIKEGDETFEAVLNIGRITAITLDYLDDEFAVIIYTTGGDQRFDDNAKIIYDAFKLALIGESVTIESVGYVRPLRAASAPKEPSLEPIKYFDWRSHA